VLLAFLLGAVSGAAVALLYAPVTGRETARVSRREGCAGAIAQPTGQKGRRRSARGANRATAIERGREAYQQRVAGRRVSPDRPVSRIIAVATLVSGDRAGRRHRAAGLVRRIQSAGESGRAGIEAALYALECRRA